jgi:flagellar hook-associated protein 1 FlgK
MGDINRVLYTAKEAIVSNLTAINVTGANIANVNTPGYSRLRPMFETVGSSTASSTQDQIGVRISEVERIYDRFLEFQLVQQNSTVANYTAQQDYLQRVEGILNESIGGGINDALGAFLNTWGDLSVDPSSKAKRDAVVSTGQNLAYVFNQRAQELTNIQISANESVADTVSILNRYLKQMSSFNEIIVNAQSAGASATSVKDQRVSLLNEISKLVDINYIEKEDGSLYIFLPDNGKALVEGFNSWELGVERNTNNNNFYDIVFTENPTQSVNHQISGGKLAGLLSVRDTAIPSYLDELNQTSSSIINKVNELHMSGYDQDKNPGGLFFELTSGAAYMKVSAAIITDARKIAASATVNADGNNAAAITAIKNDQMYASMRTVSTTGLGKATGRIDNIGQVFKNTTGDIILTRGALPGDWTLTNNGGYGSLSVLTSNDTSVTLDFNGDATADLTLSLTGTWANGNTISFAMVKNANTTSIDGYFNSFIANMGQDLVNVAQSLSRETTILNQQTDQREQLSGVSLDEEMMNLIKYQMAYNAAGRIAKSVTEMMDLLINLGR